MSTRRELEAEIRQLMPDFDYCSECGKPIWGLESMARGMGPICALNRQLARLAQEGRERHEARTLAERRDAYRRQLEAAAEGQEAPPYLEAEATGCLTGP